MDQSDAPSAGVPTPLAAPRRDLTDGSVTAGVAVVRDELAGGLVGWARRRAESGDDAPSQ
jgi:hypothetical protein